MCEAAADSMSDKGSDRRRSPATGRIADGAGSAGRRNTTGASRGRAKGAREGGSEGRGRTRRREFMKRATEPRLSEERATQRSGVRRVIVASC